MRVRIIGEREGLTAGHRALLDEAEDLTRDNTGLTLVVAFNYGGRQEIVRAVAQARRAGEGRDDSTRGRSTSTPSRRDSTRTASPIPDLVIRTSGEQRVSNFLTWQTAYSEFVFLPDSGPTSTIPPSRRPSTSIVAAIAASAALSARAG